MKKIFSRVKPEMLLHVVQKRVELEAGRQELCPESEYLQVASFGGDKGKTFKPHAHIKLDRNTDITQESWVIIEGRVEAIYYDLDDKVIAREILEPGDVTITFRGGHNFVFLEDGSRVYEFKTGPYFGQAKDKRILD